MLDLQGRTAIVTGAASGIGAACASLLEGKGVTVARWDITDAAGIIGCNVANAAAVDAAMERTLAEAGTPTLLVAAAGVADATPIMDMDVDTWDHVLGVNLRGVMLCVQAVARVIAREKLDGSMVAIASINGQVADPGLSAYSSSKAAVFHFVRVAARELGPLGIRVNAIGPGPTETPMLQPSLDDPDYRRRVVLRTPLGEVGTPLRVAESVVSLLEMDWVTGEAIMADGGASLSTGRVPSSSADIE